MFSAFSATYRSLLRTRGAAAFFLTATVGRIGIAMTGLGLLWLVHTRTGSYATAGLVTGGFAIAEAVVGPQIARLVDRFGQPRVLPPLLLAHATAVAVLLILAVGGAPSWSLPVGGVLAGATIPQLGALSAARWPGLLEDRPDELPSAFALESLGNAVAFLVGPVLASVLGAAGYPEVGTMLAATLVVSGGLALAAQRRTAPPPAASREERVHAGRTLLRPAFLLLVGLNVAIGVYFGSMSVAMTAFPAEHGAADRTGLIFFMSSGSGLLAGWLYGMRRRRTSPRTQLVVATAALTVAVLVVLAVDSTLWLGFAVVLTGAGVPPILVLFSVLTESTIHRAALTQAFTWHNSASAAGSAGAAAIAGWAVDAVGADGGFGLALAAAALMTALAGLGVRALRTPETSPDQRLVR